MKIRDKLTLWYAVVLFFSLFLLGGLLFNEWVLEPRRDGSPLELDTMQETTQDLAINLLIIALPAAFLGLGGGWILTRKAMNPISRVTEAASALDEKNLHVRLSQSGNGDEIDRLTSVFNGMTARLESSFTRIREFTLRASHELKTPLTIMRGEMESIMTQKDVPEFVRRQLEQSLEEIDRLASIVDGLTLLTKADASLVVMNKEKLRLDFLVEEIFQDAQILAHPKKVSVCLQKCESVTILGDMNRIRQLLLNLVDNAVKYNHEGGCVYLGLRKVDKKAELTVKNDGRGLSSDELEQVFEPFYRAEASHSREVDGCGLGLAIIRWIVTAHGGEISIHSAPESETVVTVMFPFISSDDE